MAAFYNEIDPYAAEWIKNLIAARLIADGVVDTRSIVDVAPDDLREFTQCHFFAGIGVWSYALRLAGWADERPVWTGSCPCQPFSVAGRAGGFADERHLWPHWHHLIRECRPPKIFGEQVASKDGLAWLDLVLADLEGEDYAAAAVDSCSAGVGAPHIRQRLSFVAHRLADSAEQGWIARGRQQQQSSDGAGETRLESGRLRDARRMDNNNNPRLEGHAGHGDNAAGRSQQARPVAAAGRDGGVADDMRTGRSEGRTGAGEGSPSSSSSTSAQRPSPTNGFWRAADWLLCRDGKWRPVEPGTFPLAHGAPARVGRLRAYGNAINAEAQAEFIKAAMDVMP